MSIVNSSKQRSNESWNIGKYFDKFKNSNCQASVTDPVITNNSSNRKETCSPTSAAIADPNSEKNIKSNNDKTIASGLSSAIHSNPNRVFNSVDNMIGTIRIEVFGMKYISLSKPSILIQVENCMFPSYSTSFDHMFHFSDISSEILILILEEYDINNNSDNIDDNIIKQPSYVNCDNLTNSSKIRGQIVLPTAQYVTLLSPKTVQKEWRQFLALYTTANSNNLPIISDRSVGQFYSGDENFSGSALKKTRQKIGFVELSIELQLLDNRRPYQLYFAKPYHYYYLRDRKLQQRQLQRKLIQSTKQQHSDNLNLLSKYLYSYNNANNIQTQTEIETPSDNYTTPSPLALHYTLTQLTRRIKYILNCLRTPLLFTPFLSTRECDWTSGVWLSLLRLQSMGVSVSIVFNGFIVLRGGSSSGRGSGGGEAIVVAWNDYFEGDIAGDSDVTNRDVNKNSAIGKTAGINKSSDTVGIDNRTNNNIASPNIRSSKETTISSSSPRDRSSSSTHGNNHMSYSPTTHQNTTNGTSNNTATHNNDATLAAAASSSGKSSTHNHIHSDSSPFILAAATSAYINLLTDITSTLETLYHALHFTADFKTSFLFYNLLLMVALLSSFVIAVLSIGGYIFVIGLMLILAITLRKQIHYLLEFSSSGTSDSSDGEPFVVAAKIKNINSSNNNRENINTGGNIITDNSTRIAMDEQLINTKNNTAINNNNEVLATDEEEISDNSDHLHHHPLQPVMESISSPLPLPSPETMAAMSMLIDSGDIDFVDYLTVSDEEYFTRVVAAAAVVDSTTIHNHHNNDDVLEPPISSKKNSSAAFKTTIDSHNKIDDNEIPTTVNSQVLISSQHHHNHSQQQKQEQRHNHHNRQQQQSKHHHRHLPVWLVSIGKPILRL